MRTKHVEKVVVICEANRQSLNSFLVTVHDPCRDRGVTEVSEPTHDRELCS